MDHFYPLDYAPHRAKKRRKRRTDAERTLGDLLDEAQAALGRRTRDPLPEALAAAYVPPRPGATALDFGCGSPKTLSRLRAAGWRTIGIDLSERVVADVRAAGHEALQMEPGVWSRLPERLDLVRMNHVLEHLFHPRETLLALRERLADDGLLHVAVPNGGGLSTRVFGARSFVLDCPRHVMLYTPAALERLAREVGFSRVRLLHETVAKDFSRSVAYLLDDLGLDRAARAVSARALHPLAIAGLLLPARVAALLRRADRFHAFLRP